MNTNFYKNNYLSNFSNETSYLKSTKRNSQNNKLSFQEIKCNTCNSLNEVECFLCNFSTFLKYLKLYNLLK